MANPYKPYQIAAARLSAARTHIIDARTYIDNLPNLGPKAEQAKQMREAVKTASHACGEAVKLLLQYGKEE